MESRVQPYLEAHRRDEKSVTAEALRPYLWLFAVVLVAVLPFAGRAIYLDEPQYLHVANSALERDWRFPQDTPWVFFGNRHAHLGAQAHPPVVQYYLAAIMMLTEEYDEAAFRLAFAIFPFVAVAAFYRLARRFTDEPLLVSILFAVSPAFFVLSPTLMMDIPMLAFLLAGLSFYMDALENRKRLWLASMCWILGVGTGYVVLIPLGCVFVWALWNNRPRRELVAIAVVPAAVCVWLLVLTIHFGELPAAELVGYYASHTALDRTILPALSFIGGVTLFPWMYLALAGASRKWMIAAISILGGTAVTWFTSWPSAAYRVWFILLASSGIGLLIHFTFEVMRPEVWRIRHKPLGFGFLALWLPAGLLFFLLSAEMMTARYLLLCMPPLFLVAFAEMRRHIAPYAIAATLMLSLALAVGDYRLVKSYRDWVALRVGSLQEQGFVVWNGAESGLRFYLEREGVETLDSSDLRPRAGDLIVRQASFRYGLAKDLEPLLVQIGASDLHDSYPLRTFSREAGAGFHDSGFGIVPYVISPVPLDRLEVVQVSPFVTELPQNVPQDYASVPVWSPEGVLLKQVEPEMRFAVRIPEHARIEYELEGKGTVIRSRDGIILKKEGQDPILWKNFRIVPPY